jgi:translation initiation factor eIF-2B subunit gamma
MKIDPHLTSFHSHPSIIAPKGLDMTMGTAQLLRLPEVQRVITTDFIIVPCDLICELPGESLIEAWMATQGVLEPTRTAKDRRNSLGQKPSRLDVQQKGRRGALAVFYQTIDRRESVQGEFTDFVAVAPLTHDEAPVITPADIETAAIRFNISKLLLTMPMGTAKEKMEQDKGLLLRHSLLQTHGRIRILTSFRDAHIYVSPYWVKEMVHSQRRLHTIGQDLVGNWTKAGWQEGLGITLGLTRPLYQDSQSDLEESSFESNIEARYMDQKIDLQRMSTTKSALNTLPPKYIHPPKSSKSKEEMMPPKAADLPQILSYIHRGPQLIRRIDHPAILLSTSLLLAKLQSIDEVGKQAASPFAHAHKISSPELVAKRSIVSQNDCLLGDNVTIESTCVIKESCIASNCHIHSGARINRCVLMEGAVVEAKALLNGCIIGRHARIGRESVLRDCEVQDANILPEKMDARDQKLMVFEELRKRDDGWRANIFRASLHAMT